MDIIEPTMGSREGHRDDFIYLLDQYLVVIDKLSSQRNKVTNLEEVKSLRQDADAALQQIKVAELTITQLRTELAEIEQQIRSQMPDFEAGNLFGIIGPQNYQDDGEQQF